MDWFLYDKDVRHEELNGITALRKIKFDTYKLLTHLFQMHPFSTP